MIKAAIYDFKMFRLVRFENWNKKQLQNASTRNKWCQYLTSKFYKVRQSNWKWNEATRIIKLAIYNFKMFKVRFENEGEKTIVKSLLKPRNWYSTPTALSQNIPHAGCQMTFWCSDVWMFVCCSCSCSCDPQQPMWHSELKI